MSDIDLNSITEQHLLGTWEISRPHIDQQHEGHLLASVSTIEFQEQNLVKFTHPGEVTGSWILLRHSELIYNPLLRFYINQHEIGAAIVTRYHQTAKLMLNQMTLYFNPGLELMLQKPRG